MAEKLENLAGTLLASSGLTLAVAESCTGGLLGHLITEVPGSSEYFLGGVIAYGDSLKIDLLDVPPPVIKEHGAVSAECALRMAVGVRGATGAGIGISITGIAGPSGGTAAKPVGTVYIGLAADASEQVERFNWHGNRSENKRLSAEAALRMLIDFLESPSHESLRAPASIQQD